MKNYEKSLLALDAAYRVYCEKADQPGSVVGLQDAIAAYLAILAPPGSFVGTLPERLRAHYQECDNCNRDLLIAADNLEVLLEAMTNIAHYGESLNSLSEGDNMREIADDALRSLS